MQFSNLAPCHECSETNDKKKHSELIFCRETGDKSSETSDKKLSELTLSS